MVLRLYPMPPTRGELLDLLRGVCPAIQCAYVEEVHSMPVDSARSMFSFGQYYERVLVALLCLEIPHELVRPTQWMRAVGLPLGKDAKRGAGGRRSKVPSRELARQLFPQARGITNATAEALLIAEAGRRLRGRKTT